MYTKKIGLILRHAPYGSDLAQEAIDALLSLSSYSSNISVIFMGDGIFQLLREQQPREKIKSIQKQLSALELYDINSVFVCEHSLMERGIAASTLSLPIKPLSLPTLRHIIHEQDVLLSF